jgi:hypothetical protein
MEWLFGHAEIEWRESIGCPLNDFEKVVLTLVIRLVRPKTFKVLFSYEMWGFNLTMVLFLRKINFENLVIRRKKVLHMC